MKNTMKNYVIWTLSILAMSLFVVFATVLIKQPNAKAENYPTMMKIVQIDLATDKITGIDANGNLWQWYGIEDLMINDYVAVIMSDKGTENNIYDDEVIEVRYCGTKEDF